ncbi:hypothetical protein PYCC9005_005956 [Savitreella phatthalungensis]
MRMARRLIIDSTKGAESLQLHPRCAFAYTCKHFHLRYFPARTSAAALDSASKTRTSAEITPVVTPSKLSHFEQHTQTVRLSSRLQISFSTSVSATSKSSVVRHQIVRRLRSALLAELQSRFQAAERKRKLGGDAVVPAREMHLVFLARGLGAATVEWRVVKKLVWEGYQACVTNFEGLSTKKQDKLAWPRNNTPFTPQPKLERLRSTIGPPSSRTPQHAHNPALRGRLTQSRYLRASGGVDELVKKMLQG